MSSMPILDVLITYKSYLRLPKVLFNMGLSHHPDTYGSGRWISPIR